MPLQVTLLAYIAKVPEFSIAKPYLSNMLYKKYFENKKLPVYRRQLFIYLTAQVIVY